MASADKSGRSPATLATAEIAAGLALALQDRDCLFIARDEARAVEVAALLAAAAPEALVIHVPASDALPGDPAPPSPANVGQRSAGLRRIRLALEQEMRPHVALVGSGEAAARLYPPPEAYGAAPPVVTVGQALDLQTFSAQLEALGYAADERVDEPGEMAVHGQVVDLFPADSGHPFRIEMQDGRVASIRPFDAASQLTDGECERIEVGRVTEPPLGDGFTLAAHLPEAALAVEPGADRRRLLFLRLARDAARRRPSRPIADMDEEDLWGRAAAGRDRLSLEPSGDPPPRFVETSAPLPAFRRFARRAMAAGDRLLLVGTGRDLRFVAPRAAKALGREVQAVPGLAAACAAPEGALMQLEMPALRGFSLPGLRAVAAADLIGSRAQRPGEERPAGEPAALAQEDLRPGDLVIHEDHGLAQVVGLEALAEEEGTGKGDAIVLLFAREARRLVPVAEAHRLWRYGGEAGAVTLDRLDGSGWEKKRGEIEAAVTEAAERLSALAEEKARRKAPVLDPDPAAFERFVSAFPFTETADQARAIASVRDDLASGRPMDRLVVGDVGFGKTEVAMRAAAIAVLAGRQVVVAAPTTVLVRQHVESFAARFAELDVEVASLSRLSSAAERKRVKAGVADGSIRVLIGTGAVASKGMAYADLGLVIIDEEQKFGAADKARLRALGAAHSLTLSATPIPRTLQNALVGLQDYSVIATPPARRQPIASRLVPMDPAIARAALMRERSRGGQSFVVVPRIEDMEGVSSWLARAVPELRIVSAHGKMPAAEADAVMVGFAGGDGDVLLATNIIEAGLDVPRANTMIIWRADRFGLAQLHQLRGRVGRSARRGQMLMMMEKDAVIPARTLKRLKTLESLDRLGAGFAIAARDLDLRGAGELGGEDQTGHERLIGVDLYQHLLEQALRRLRGEAETAPAPQLVLGLEGRLPEDWIAEETVRLALYWRLARVADAAALSAFEAELADRFGEPPPPAERLLSLARIRLLARDLGIARVDAGPAAIALSPGPGFAGGTAGLEEKEGRLLLREAHENAAERAARLESLLAEMKDGPEDG